MDLKAFIRSYLAKSPSFTLGIYIKPHEFRNYRVDDHFLQMMEKRNVAPKHLILALKKGKQYAQSPREAIIIFYKDIKIVADYKKVIMRTVIRDPRFKKWSFAVPPETKILNIGDIERLSEIKLD